MNIKRNFVFIILLLGTFSRVAEAQAPPPCYTYFSGAYPATAVTTRTLNVGAASSGQFVQAAVYNGYEGSCTIGTSAPSWIVVNPLSFTAREFFQEHAAFNLIIEANQGAQRIGTVTLGNATVTVIQSGSPDLSISNAEGNVIQTVIGAEAFVADKSTVVTVTIRATQPDLLPTSGVTLDVFFDNRVERVTVPKSDFFQVPAGVALAIVNPTDRFRPAGKSLTVRAVVDPISATKPKGDIEETNESNNSFTTGELRVISKPPLNIAYVPIAGCKGSRFCYNEPSLLNLTRSGGDEYVSEHSQSPL